MANNPVTAREVHIGRASRSDADAIALLHAESWRDNYRGAYSDRFLDGAVFQDRRHAWTTRLQDESSSAITLVARAGTELAGFAHTIREEDPMWGALLDNLHVAPAFKRQGVGRKLMAASARAVLKEKAGTGLYLWVLEQNTAAQDFYRRLGGVFEGKEHMEAKGGGSIIALRVAWHDLELLGAEAADHDARVR